MRSGSAETDGDAVWFVSQRPRLRALAYRMLGSLADADDILQDAWLRFAATDTRPDRPDGWITTVTTRLCIDRLKSAHRQRESYVGPWLPEPVLADDDEALDASGDPERQLVLSESLTFGFHTVLQRLSPLERAVFLLHDVFAMPLAEVAAVVERSDAATRQLAKRARDHMRADKPRYAPEPEDIEALTDAFFLAALSGDLIRLESLLHDDCVQINDGGPKYRASRYPVVGRTRVARFMASLVKKIPAGAEVHRVRANGQFGYYTTVNGEPFMVIVVMWVDGKIASSHGVRNVDKLRHFHEAWLRAQARSSADDTRTS